MIHRGGLHDVHGRPGSLRAAQFQKTGCRCGVYTGRMREIFQPHQLNMIHIDLNYRYYVEISVVSIGILIINHRDSVGSSWDFYH